MGLIDNISRMFSKPEAPPPKKMSEMDLGQKKPAMRLQGATFSRSDTVRTTTPAPSGVKIDTQMATADLILGNKNWTLENRNCRITRNPDKSERATNETFDDQKNGVLDTPNNSAAARYAAKLKSQESEGKTRQIPEHTKSVFANSNEKRLQAIENAKNRIHKIKPASIS